MRKTGRGWLAAALAGLALLPQPAMAKGVKLTFGYSAISGSNIPLWTAQDAGFFEKQGLDVTLVYISSGPKAVAAILAGELAISVASGEALVRARLNGADVVAIAEQTGTFVFSLVTLPSVKRPEDLKGKALGVTRFGASTHRGLLEALKHFGLVPGRDVTVLQVGGVPEILASMEGGRIAGGVLSPPTSIVAKQKGYHELLDIGSLGIPFQQAAYVAREAYLRQHPNVARAFVRGIVEAIHRVKSDRALAKRVLAKYTKVQDDAILEETYRLFVTNRLKPIPYPAEAAIKTVLDDAAETNPKARAANPKEFMDPRWLRELEDSGFVRQLGR
jgi:ABC-type nitrate/sulfonate/bicarbonate transport system substrate-binding protein